VARTTFTFDLEDHRPSPQAWPARYPAITESILDWMDGRGIRATVFVVGELAQRDPDLVRAVADRGHEIGLHNWRHVQLTAQRPDEFRAGIRRGKAALEDVIGSPVLGFRAPTGSLVPASSWAVDILAEEGYRYSSSVCPGRNPINSFPGAPEEPFRYPNGLLEFPAPVSGLGPFKLPYLGGTYIRVLPEPAHRVFRWLAPVTDGAVIYCHPYDFDVDEPFWWVGDVGWLSPLLWMGRSGFTAKLERLTAGGTSAPLGDQLHRAEQGPVFDPTPPPDR
jgi:peptidoglycan-N-acetylglucosamine deacetylase